MLLTLRAGDVCWLALSLLVVGGTALPGDAHRKQGTTPRVKIAQGVAVGTTAKTYGGREFNAYKGIPYAQPPVGDLRFRAPQPVAAGVADIDASLDGPMCMQKNYLQPVPSLQGQEDCLYLNVYTPQVGVGVKLPVMVYIHGGGWFTGTGASYINGPDYLLDKDIVLVTLNYRLGALGFLSTGDSAAPGNYGMKDQVAALRWVRDNIAAFGGDANLVTIFGQSAGAASVHYHMVAPPSQGLFHRAITQSGSALGAWAWPGDALPVARLQAKFVNCPQDDTTRLVACLRTIDAANLTDSGDNFHFWSIDPLTTYVPVLESSNRVKRADEEEAFLTEDPLTLIKSGRFARVPWMVGVVAQEGMVRALPIVSDATLLADLNSQWSTLGPELLEIEKSVGKELVDQMWTNITKFYLNDDLPLKTDQALGFIDLYSDRSFVHGVHKSVLLHAAQGHKSIYMYNFDYPGLYSYANLFAQNPTKYGVSHCDDLIYLFRSPLLFADWPQNHPDLKVMHMFISLWTDFAKHGNPTPGTATSDNHVTCDLTSTNSTCDLSSLHWTPVSTPTTPGSKLRTSFLHVHRATDVNPPRDTLDFDMALDLYKARMEFWDSAPLKENSLGGLPNHVHTVQVLSQGKS